MITSPIKPTQWTHEQYCPHPRISHKSIWSSLEKSILNETLITYYFPGIVSENLLSIWSVTIFFHLILNNWTCELSRLLFNHFELIRIMKYPDCDKASSVYLVKSRICLKAVQQKYVFTSFRIIQKPLKIKQRWVERMILFSEDAHKERFKLWLMSGSEMPMV